MKKNSKLTASKTTSHAKNTEVASYQKEVLALANAMEPHLVSKIDPSLSAENATRKLENALRLLFPKQIGSIVSF